MSGHPGDGSCLGVSVSAWRQQRWVPAPPCPWPGQAQTLCDGAGWLRAVRLGLRARPVFPPTRYWSRRSTELRGRPCGRSRVSAELLPPRRKPCEAELLWWQLCVGVCVVVGGHPGPIPRLLLSRDSAGGPRPRRGSLSEWVSGLHPGCQEEGSRAALRPWPRWRIATTLPRLALDLRAGQALRSCWLRGSCCPCQPPSPGLALEGGWVSQALEEGTAGEMSDRDRGRRATPSLQASWCQFTPCSPAGRFYTEGSSGGPAL